MDVKEFKEYHKKYKKSKYYLFSEEPSSWQHTFTVHYHKLTYNPFDKFFIISSLNITKSGKIKESGFYALPEETISDFLELNFVNQNIYFLGDEYSKEYDLFNKMKKTIHEKLIKRNKNIRI